MTLQETEGVSGDPDRPWTRLSPGERFQVRSFSRQQYTMTFLVAGPKATGLYVRTEKGGLGRLDPKKVDWSTLKVLDGGPAAVVGDDIVVKAAFKGGEATPGHWVEYYGELAEAITDEIVLTSYADGKQTRVPYSLTEPTSFRVGFTSTQIREGDEFLVESHSGNRYHGRVVNANLQDKVPTIQVWLNELNPNVTMNLENLETSTLRILIAVPLRFCRAGARSSA